MVTDSILDLIGNTPIVRLGLRIYAKAEFLNPGGSIKDRVALAMIEGGEREDGSSPTLLSSSRPRGTRGSESRWSGG